MEIREVPVTAGADAPGNPVLSAGDNAPGGAEPPFRGLGVAALAAGVRLGLLAAVLLAGELVLETLNLGGDVMLAVPLRAAKVAALLSALTMKVRGHTEGHAALVALFDYQLSGVRLNCHRSFSYSAG